jgi:hypothetical protein
MDRLLFQGRNADLSLVLSGSHEVDSAVNFCEKRMVATHSDVRSGRKYSSALPHKDVTSPYRLASESLHTQSL